MDLAPLLGFYVLAQSFTSHKMPSSVCDKIVGSCQNQIARHWESIKRLIRRAESESPDMAEIGQASSTLRTPSVRFCDPVGPSLLTLRL
jgi:hypothetical protein